MANSITFNFLRANIESSVPDFIKFKITELALRSEFHFEEVEVDKDHVNIMLTITPSICVTSYIR